MSGSSDPAARAPGDLEIARLAQRLTQPIHRWEFYVVIVGLYGMERVKGAVPVLALWWPW